VSLDAKVVIMFCLICSSDLLSESELDRRLKSSSLAFNKLVISRVLSKILF
jgi:hypothetical protein